MSDVRKKIVLVGLANVGKTTMRNSLDGAATADYVPTLGVEVVHLYDPSYADAARGGAPVVWDTAGDPRFAGMGASIYAEFADAILAVHPGGWSSAAAMLADSAKMGRARVFHVINVRAGDVLGTAPPLDVAWTVLDAASPAQCRALMLDVLRAIA